MGSQATQADHGPVHGTFEVVNVKVLEPAVRGGIVESLGEFHYEFRDGSHFSKVDPQAAGEYLMELSRQNGGFTADELVEAARDPNNVLHNAFEWNDTEAAFQYRKWQGRELAGSVMLVWEDRTIAPTRAFVNITVSSQPPIQKNLSVRLYMRLEQALSEGETRIQLLEKALKDADAWMARYNTLTELARVFDSILEMQVRVSKLKEDLKNHSQEPLDGNGKST